MQKAFHETISLGTDESMRHFVVAALAHKLETTQPAAFAELYQSYSMKPWLACVHLSLLQQHFVGTLYP